MDEFEAAQAELLSGLDEDFLDVGVNLPPAAEQGLPGNPLTEQQQVGVGWLRRGETEKFDEDG